MKITGGVEIETVIDVVCDACSSSTRSENGGLQYASLHAHWGYGTRHDGERDCFFKAIAYLKQELRTENLFSDKVADAPDDFGLVARDGFFGEEGNR